MLLSKDEPNDRNISFVLRSAGSPTYEGTSISAQHATTSRHQAPKNLGLAKHNKFHANKIQHNPTMIERTYIQQVNQWIIALMRARAIFFSTPSQNTHTHTHTIRAACARLRFVCVCALCAPRGWSNQKVYRRGGQIVNGVQYNNGTNCWHTY